MIIRPFQDSDIEIIDEIWRRPHRDAFSVPNRKTKIVEWVAEEEGKFIAYGQLKLFAEAMLVIDKDASRRAKVEALKYLLLEGFRGANLAGLEDIYCFVKEPSFGSILINHFGFESTDPGELLIRRI